MKSILIWGDSDAGKSTACLKLLKILIALDGQLVFYKTLEWGDFYATLIFEGHKICIYSAGDAKCLLKGAFEFGESEGAEVLVGVLSTGKHYREVLEDYEENKDYFWYLLPFAEEIATKSDNQNHLITKILEMIYKLLGVTIDI